MNINIKLDKNFTTVFNKLCTEKGQKLRNLNGFGQSQLNYTDFIDNFVDKNTVADASIDGSANVGTKDITSLVTQMSKPHSKLLAFNKIFYELNKKYGYKVASDWLSSEYEGYFYLHDSSSSTWQPYSYKGSQLVVVKYKEKLLLVSFEQLFDLVEEPVELLCEEDEAFCKYTNDLVVWDENNTWTNVVRVIRKPKTKDFHFIKANNGMSEIVTSNHPVITTNGDKNACDVTVNDYIKTEKFECEFGKVDEIFCLDFVDKNKPVMFKGQLFRGGETNKDGQVCYLAATNPIQNRIKCDFEFGWLVGIIIAEGHYANDNIVITQNKGDIFDEIIRICEKRNFGYHIKPKENCQSFNIIIKSKVLSDVISNAFSKNAISHEKALNPNIFDYNKQCIKGIVAGLLDGDGTLTQAQGRRIHIRMSSRTLINQIAFLMRMFGYTVREQTPTAPNDNINAFIKQKRYIYHVAFTPYKDVENFDSIKIRNHNVEYTSSEEEGRYTNGKYTFGFGEKQISNNVVLDKDTDEYVYDISVETGHFMCNGILSHNCFAYDIEQLVKKGLFFIDDFNAQPPQHLTTYTDFVGQFVSWVSNRSSGACGLPSFLIYSFYFWKKDCISGDCIRNPEYYRDQQFQRIIYKLNQPYLRINQSAFTNFSIFDKDYLVELFGGKEFPDGSFIIDYIDQILEYEKAFMRVVSDIRSKNVMTFPVLTFALLRDKEGKWGDENFARWCCEHNMKWNDSNFFISDSITSLSNCCRLVSNVNQMGYFNSIGGSALQVGSIKVNTINLARLSYENDKQNYFEVLKKKVILNLQCLDIVRGIIKRNIDKGLLPNYSKGIMNMQNQYNTVGIIGIYEVVQKYGMIKKDEFGYVSYTEQGLQFAKKILNTIHDTINEFRESIGNSYKINVEQVPAQRAAVILMQKDKIYHPEENYEKPLYGNQWIPLAVKTTMQQKIRVSAELDKSCNGGSIAHINLSAPFNNFEQAWETLNMVADSGVVYFAFCTRISACKNNHGFFGQVCPYCGEPVVTKYNRIVGFLVPDCRYSSQRKQEFGMRTWFDVLSDEHKALN